MQTFLLVTSRRALPGLVVLGLLATAGVAPSAVIEYANPAGAQDFMVGANWVGGVAPSASDEARISGVDGVTNYAYLDTAATLQRLQIAAAGSTGGLELRSGAALSVTANVNGATQIGEGVGGGGHLRIENGASLNTVHSLLIGQIGGQATATQTGGLVHAGLGLRLANGGATPAAATYTMNGGELVNGTVNGGTVGSMTLFQIGGGEGTTGSFFMNGGTVTSNGPFRMARNGATASFIQTGGDLLAKNLLGGNALELAIQGTNSNGLYEIRGGSFAADVSAGGIVVGSTGTARGTFKVVGNAPTVSIGGKYEQRAGGTLALDIAAGISPLNVQGFALIDGTLDVKFTQVPSVGQQFTILNYSDSLVGTFPTFDTVVDSPAGADTVTLSINYGTTFNSSIVLTVDSVTSTLVPGDFDGDGDVDGADFVAWQTNFPKAGGAILAEGDADGDGDVDGADFVVWQTNFPFTPAPGASQIPEPMSMILIVIGVATSVAFHRRWLNEIP